MSERAYDRHKGAWNNRDKTEALRDREKGSNKSLYANFSSSKADDSLQYAAAPSKVASNRNDPDSVDDRRGEYRSDLHYSNRIPKKNSSYERERAYDRPEIQIKGSKRRADALEEAAIESNSGRAHRPLYTDDDYRRRAASDNFHSRQKASYSPEVDRRHPRAQHPVYFDRRGQYNDLPPRHDYRNAPHHQNAFETYRNADNEYSHRNPNNKNRGRNNRRNPAAGPAPDASRDKTSLQYPYNHRRPDDFPSKRPEIAHNIHSEKSNQLSSQGEPNSLKNKQSDSFKTELSEEGKDYSPDEPQDPEQRKLYNARVVITHGVENMYLRQGQVGEGTYGKVYKALNKVTGAIVALKRVKIEKEKDGFPVTSIREIRLLQELRHERIISLLELMVDNNHIYMVLDYMDHDLSGLIVNKQFTLTEPNTKDLTIQILHALNFLHSRGVLHRDMKGSNILLNNNGELKLADFGLARFHSRNSLEQGNYTNRVITLWYRPLELLLGSTSYGPEADIWGVGCIVCELFTRRALLNGQDEVHQIELIFSILGTPNEETWPQVRELPWYTMVRPRNPQPERLYQILDGVPTQAIDFIRELLALNPKARLLADKALKHSYLNTEPFPARCTGLDKLGGDWHEFESKRKNLK